MNTRVAIIGAGFSGLSAACEMASKGYETHVFEKHNQPGGRARAFQTQGFTFDMGPSWYWMPEIFDEFFQTYGFQRDDFYELVRLNPSYRVFFEKYELDVPASVEELGDKLEIIEPGAKQNLKRFLEEAKFKYETGMGEFVWKPSLSPAEYLDMRLLKAGIKIQLFSSVSNHIKKYFKHPHIVQLLEFPVLFLGAKPEKTPALYSMMNYADLELGTWYPMNGMTEIPKAMEQVAKKLGVQFHYNETVQKINTVNNRVHGLTSNDKFHEFDAVLAASDYHHVETNLIEKEQQSYSQKYWDSRTLSPSSLLFYLGFNKKIPNLLHHNLFFDSDFKQHAVEIYDTQEWPSNPLFYVCVPSKTDTTVAPENHENVFVLIPAAPGLSSTEEDRQKYLDMVLDRLEQRTHTSLREHLIYQKSFAHEEFMSEYNSFKGNAYGLANTLTQTAFLKPKLKSKKIKNLYYAGQLTVPGPGMPPSIISGKLAANLIHKSFTNAVAV